MSNGLDFELSFEERIQGLANYYDALEDLNPHNPAHNELANPNFFYYGDGHHASEPLQKAKNGVLYDMACHARHEYGVHNLGTRDLREETDEQQAERADILSVMTAPITVEKRQERAEKIADLLSKLSNGQTVRFIKYDKFLRKYEDSEDVTINVSRSLFAVFRNGHISSRTLTLQHDTPVYFPPAAAGEAVTSIEVEDLFQRTWFERMPLLIVEDVETADVQ